MDRRISIGRVGKPHGLDGSFHVADAKPALLTLRRVVELRGARHEIVRRAGTDSSPIVRLDGVSDRDAASALKGEQLTVEAEDLPQLAEGEWWAHELEGCAVHDGEREIGAVRRLLELPSCEVLEVERDAGEPLLVPMVKDAVRSVDVKARRIEVNLRFLGESQ